jgi:hypothetical protein
MMKPKVVEIGSLERGNAFRLVNEGAPYVVVSPLDPMAVGEVVRLIKEDAQPADSVLVIGLQWGELQTFDKETQVVRIQIGVQIQDVVDTEVVDV